ncbi:MAG: toll/interleukin-1 receptor domain-containing protein, partial [Bacteroidota bacterium]
TDTMNQLKSLNIVWLSGTTLVFLLMLAQTIGGHYLNYKNTLLAWLWFGLVFLPIALFLIKYRRAGIDLRGDRTIFSFTIITAIVYLLVAIGILLVQPIVDRDDPIGILLTTIAPLALFQFLGYVQIRNFIEFSTQNPKGSFTDFYNKFTFKIKPLDLNTDKHSIFVCYSGKDEEWIKRMQVHLAAILRNNKLDIWTHDDILAGDEIQNSVSEAINKATIAIILVSADFFASDTLYKQLSQLLKRAKEEKSTYIIPIIASPVFVDENEAIFQHNSLNPTDQPLQSLNEAQQEGYMAELTKIVQSLLKT